MGLPPEDAAGIKKGGPGSNVSGIGQSWPVKSWQAGYPPGPPAPPFFMNFRGPKAHPNRRPKAIGCPTCLLHHDDGRAPEGELLGLRIQHRSEEHTSELQSLRHLVCRLLLEKKKNRDGDQQPSSGVDATVELERTRARL